VANPQIENGFTRIANELLEAVIRVSMSDYEHRIFWLIVRKTYGHNKKADWISQSQIAEETGILKQHVSRTIKKLADKNMILKIDKKIAIQKDYDLWKLPKQVTNESNPNRLQKVTNSGNEVTHTGYKSNLNRGTQKKKDIQKKDIHNTPHQKIMDYFNSNRNKMPSIQILSDNRKNTIRLRYKKYGDKLFTLFEKAGKSDFLNGGNKDKWIASFDWLLKETNLVKTLEGNYDNKQKENWRRT
jgi:phage replication O-like protein O